MTYPVRQRASTAALHLRDVLRAELADQIQTINTDLIAAGSGGVALYYLPFLGAAGNWSTGQILVRLQEPEIPGALTYPEVRIVPGPAVTDFDASSRSGLTSFSVSVVCYLSIAILDSARAGSGAAYPAIATGQTDEEILSLAILDLGDAVGTILRQPTDGGPDSTAGITMIQYAGARSPEYHNVNPSTGRATAAMLVLEYRVSIEQTF